MFWSLILPFLITLAMTAVVIIAANVYANRQQWRPIRSFLLIGLLAMIGFVPSCIVVDGVIAPLRFRNFHYTASEEILDQRIRQYFPDNATEITVHKRRNGFNARYKIEQSDLDAWYGDLLARTKDVAAYPGKPPTTSRRAGSDAEWVKYEGPRQSDYGGFDIWYLPDEKRAVQEAADW